MKIIITDSTLRDGNHAVKHQINLNQIKDYCQFAEKAGIPIVEVGHGNGLGASSILIGESLYSDKEMLKIARENLKNSKLGIHIIPGLATIEKNIKPAMDLGVDVFRVACHCTEATVTKSHIEYLASQNKEVFGVLMMSALASPKQLLDNALLMQNYGAKAIILMDSTGTYLPKDINERIGYLSNNLKELTKIGFHAHNNLGLAIANSIAAAYSGATYIDACIRGFGAGAGNAQLEVLLPVLSMNNYEHNIDFEKVIKYADQVVGNLIPEQNLPKIAPIHILTGLKKLFSGFEKPIMNAAQMYGLEYSSLIFELGERKLVAGQEDLILEVAQKLANKK